MTESVSNVPKQLAHELHQKLKISAKTQYPTMRLHEDVYEKHAHPYPEFSCFSRTQCHELENMFIQCDADQDGHLSLQELKRLLSEKGTPMTHLEAKTLFTQADEDGDRKLSFTEFLTLWRKITTMQATVEKCDKEGSGPEGTGLEGSNLDGELQQMREFTENVGMTASFTRVGFSTAKQFFETKANAEELKSKYEAEIWEEQRKLREQKKREREEEKREQERRKTFLSRASQFEHIPQQHLINNNK